MEYAWNGFREIRFDFEGRECALVCPETPDDGHNVAIKTEYRDAFPGTEIALLRRGFHLLWMTNVNRLATPEDCDARARLIDYAAKTYGTRPKCVPIGYSCGGAHAVNFAGMHPDRVACLYIDAPVLNFCSWPGCLGKSAEDPAVFDREFPAAYPGMTRAKLLSFPHHPINRAEALIRARIPLVMSWGTEDRTVPYDENGKLLESVYEASDVPHLILPRNWQGHHPHGFADPSLVCDFICNTMK